MWAGRGGGWEKGRSRIVSPVGRQQSPNVAERSADFRGWGIPPILCVTSEDGRVLPYKPEHMKSPVTDDAAGVFVVS